jgi:hypothetical protein
MSGTQRIIDRFPSFYKSWDSTSLLSRVVSALGKRLDEAEKELVTILRAHWVDTAMGDDLDCLGALFNAKRRVNESDPDYRDRLKRTIIEFKGGGTVEAVLTSVKMVLGLPGELIELIENPPETVSKELKVKTGEIWKLSSESISDAVPDITVDVEGDDSKITNPTLTNMDTNESITFKGIIEGGKRLTIKSGKATLDGADVTERLSTTIIPTLARKESSWRYTEDIEREIGVFDTARFDGAVFEIGIVPITLDFKWTAYRPATFEIRLPEGMITEENLSLAQGMVDSIKAVGIKATVKLSGG